MEDLFVCSFAIYFLEAFASHLRHHHPGIAATISVARPNVGAYRRGLFTACQACEPIFECEMELFQWPASILIFDVNQGSR